MPEFNKDRSFFKAQNEEAGKREKKMKKEAREWNLQRNALILWSFWERNLNQFTNLMLLQKKRILGFFFFSCGFCLWDRERESEKDRERQRLFKENIERRRRRRRRRREVVARLWEFGSPRVKVAVSAFVRSALFAYGYFLMGLIALVPIRYTCPDSNIRKRKLFQIMIQPLRLTWSSRALLGFFCFPLSLTFLRPTSSFQQQF